MARRLLVSILLVSSLLYAFEYEVVRNHDGDQDTLSLYLNNRECLCVNGGDPVATKRVYSFIARFIEQSELQNDPELIFFRSTTKGGLDIVWKDLPIITLSESEITLNEKRQNNINRLRDFAKSIQVNDSKHSAAVPMQAKTKFKPINHIQLAELAGQAFGSFFPASHPFLPIGTRLRVMNPSKDWSIVVQVVQHDKWMSENSLGVNSKAIRALGMEETGSVRTQFI